MRWILAVTLALTAGKAAETACNDGVSAFQANDYAKSRDLLERCVASRPSSVTPYLMLCGVYQALRDDTGLYRAATQGLKAFPSEPRFYLTAATIDARTKRFDSAIETLDSARQRWPDDAKIRTLLAGAEFAKGTELLDVSQNQAAELHLERVTSLAPNDVEAWLNLGRARHNLLRNTEALTAFDKALSLDPKVPLGRFHRGLSYYSLGEFERAIQDLDRQIAVDSGYAPAFLVRGLAHLSSGDWALALSDLDEATGRMPDNPQAVFGKARALVGLGKFDKAEPVLRQAIRLDPADPAPVNALVQVLLRLDQPDEARALASRAAELARNRRSAAPGEIRFQTPAQARP